MSRPGNIDYHVGRLLVLLRHFAPPGKKLSGLTKMAKLDFLLRYPAFTDRIMLARGLGWTIGSEPTDAELQAVESRMIRHKYGPWDHRYYPLLGALVGLGLAEANSKGRSLEITLTETGLRRAIEIADQDEWVAIDARANLLKRHFDISGSKLKDLIYDELPEVVDRPHQVEI